MSNLGSTESHERRDPLTLIFPVTPAAIRATVAAMAETWKTVQSTARLRHIPALDGLRAIAVLLVIAFHARLPVFGRGDLGVDIFFVLSGFLITSLLIDEVTARGRVDFARFYVHRAARLAPAYIVVVGVSLMASLALHLGGGTLRGALLSSLYVANWGAAQSASLGLLHHTWSLSIEEQFYLLWPLALALLIRFRRRAIAIVAGLLAVASLLEATSLLVAGAPLDRVANGTDTRASLLLAGCALAVVLQHHRGPMAAAAARRALDIAGLGALTVLVGVSASGITGRLVFPLLVWPMVVVTATTIITAVVRAPAGGSVFLLAAPALTWVGRRSYGLYLWHFPVFYVLDTEVGVTAWTAAIGTAVSFALAAVTFRYLEQPARLRIQAAYQVHQTSVPSVEEKFR